MNSKSSKKYTLAVLAADIVEARSFAFFGTPPAEALVFFLFLGLLQGVSGAFTIGSTITEGRIDSASSTLSLVIGAEKSTAAPLLPWRLPSRPVPFVLARRTWSGWHSPFLLEVGDPSCKWPRAWRKPEGPSPTDFQGNELDLYMGECSEPLSQEHLEEGCINVRGHVVLANRLTDAARALG